MASSPRMSVSLQRALDEMWQWARAERHEFFTLEHVTLGLTQEVSSKRALKELSVDLAKFAADLREHIAAQVPVVPRDEDRQVAEDSSEMSLEDELDEDFEEGSGSVGPERLAKNRVFSPLRTAAVGRVLQRAVVHALTADIEEIDGAVVLVQIMNEPESHAAYLLQRQGVSRLDLRRAVSHTDVSSSKDEKSDANRGDGDEEEPESNEDPLDRFCTHLNARAKSNEVDPLIGREDEVERVIHILSRRRKNNPVLVGEPGVGKTAIAEGLALRIEEKKVPKPLLDAQVYSLDMGALIAGTRFRGQFEERLKGVVKRMEEIPNSILFIDEIHTIVGAGATSSGSMDASNILKPALASGKLRCIGSTTFDEYKQSIERDRALARRFQRIDVLEPSEEDAIRILEGLAPTYGKHHDVKYSPESLRAAVKLAKKHLTERWLPDSAIDVIDEAGAADKLLPKPTKKISPIQIERIVAKMALVPVNSVSTEEKSQLQYLETKLQEYVYGQDEAIEKLVSAIKLSRAGLRNETKPIGTFLFSGPTGVGKTELARQLAKAMGVELIRFDMSEYQERHSVSRLIGSPPGYVGYDDGGMLTDSVRKHPHSVLLLDEIEKANPEIYNVLLQVMDHATLTDNRGRKADFRNIVLIMTTNAGAREISTRSIGFANLENSFESDAAKAKPAIERVFSPEFRNRMDAWLVFGQLSKQIIRRIVDKEIDAFAAQLEAKNVKLEVSDSARDWLGQKGYDPAFGARPMGRTVEEHLKRKVADAILFGGLNKGGIATFDRASFEHEEKAEGLQLNVISEDHSNNKPNKKAKKTSSEKKQKAKA